MRHRSVDREREKEVLFCCDHEQVCLKVFNRICLGPQEPEGSQSERSAESQISLAGGT